MERNSSKDDTTDYFREELIFADFSKIFNCT